MNMFELINRFWRTVEYEPCTISEAALYFFLLNRANMTRWNMPIRCPTSNLCYRLKTSKQNIIKAREALQQRGLISFIPGTDKEHIALYTLLTSTDELSVHLSDKLSDELSDGLSVQLSPIKTKDKDLNINNKGDIINKLGLDELHNRMLADDDWQNNVLEKLHRLSEKNTTKERLIEMIDQFIQFQKNSGIEFREEKDIRNHFFNWLNKKLKYNDTDKQGWNSQRRGTEVPVTKSEMYKDSF